MFRHLFSFLLVCSYMCVASTAQAGLGIYGTRVIYHGDKTDASITIKNKEDKLPYLIQVWVDNFDESDKTTPPFTAIPPVSRLEAQQERVLRIIKMPGDLPNNRESVFWLNIKSLPPSSQSMNNQLELAIRTRIKLFWRPAGISETPESAAPKVKWIRSGRSLTIVNPTAIHVNVVDVRVDNQPINTLYMIKPFQTLTIPLPDHASGHELVWRSINDYGALSEVIKQKL